MHGPSTGIGFRVLPKKLSKKNPNHLSFISLFPMTVTTLCNPQMYPLFSRSPKDDLGGLVVSTVNILSNFDKLRQGCFVTFMVVATK